MISDFRSYGSDMTYINLVFPIEWLIHGIVYLTGLFLLTPLTYLKLDWVNFGTVKILYMILEHSCREPEVVVKCCVRNFSNFVYCKLISSSPRNRRHPPLPAPISLQVETNVGGDWQNSSTLTERQV